MLLVRPVFVAPYGSLHDLLNTLLKTNMGVIEGLPNNKLKNPSFKSFYDLKSFYDPLSLKNCLEYGKF